ncbi:MAG: hypothetical protein ABFC24_04025 [Methanoregulaceae archaeon]
MPAGSPQKRSSGPRLLSIDNVRIFLVSLVITTHSAITLGSGGRETYAAREIKRRKDQERERKEPALVLF